MSKTTKRQKRRLTLVITATLLVVWLTVSVVFSYIVLTNEKDSLITQEQQRFSRLIGSIEEYMHPSYGGICLSIEQIIEHYDIYLEEDSIAPIATYGAYPYHDNTMHIIALGTELSIGDDGVEADETIIIDTDKHDYALFICNSDGTNTYREGKLEYDSFISSMSDEQHKEICDYLYNDTEKGGVHYVLVCSEFYYTSPGVIAPKTVSIRKIDTKTDELVSKEIVKQYTLNPKVSENAKLFVSNNTEDVNIIPGDFVVGNYSSGGLITDTHAKFISNILDDLQQQFYGIIENTGFLTYTYENIDNIQMPMISEQYHDDFLEEYIPMGPQSLDNQIITIHYKKAIDVLKSAQNKLLTGLLSILAFFLIIGLVLIISVRKIITAQEIEEEKRRQVTNALAHDIKTPLFIASGYAQNLKEDVNSDKREHYAQKIIDHTNEINELIHKMLDFSNIDNLEQTISKEDIDLCEITHKIVRDFENLHSIKINVNCSTPCIINADKNLITRAVSYLIDNAVRYCDTDSAIDITIDKDSFFISNVCKTLTQNDVKHIFEPYYKADKNRNSKGNGLGLSIVKSSLELHNFKITAKLDKDIITFAVSFNK